MLELEHWEKVYSVSHTHNVPSAHTHTQRSKAFFRCIFVVVAGKNVALVFVYPTIFGVCRLHIHRNVSHGKYRWVFGLRVCMCSGDSYPIPLRTHTNAIEMVEKGKKKTKIK